VRIKTLALTTTLLAAAPAARPADKPLDVYWIDVEGGAATLIVTPAGESVLIDAGNPGGRDAARIHKVATEAAGLKRIDHLLLTHFHVDHFGGVAELARLMPVGVLHERDLEKAPEGERGQASLAPYKTAAVERRAAVKAGALPLRQAGGVPLALEVLGADGRFEGQAAARDNPACRVQRSQGPDASDNRNSVVTRLRFGTFRFFDGGDLTWQNEADLVCPKDRVGPVDVFQIEHHGSDTSNNPALVRTLAPSIVVINNGPRKGGEPASFAAVQATPSVQAVYQVHRSLRFPGSNTLKERIANEEEDCAANFIKLSVEPDGRRYTMWVPATGHRQSYATRAAADVAAARVEVVPREAERRVDVSVDGLPFTAYLWPDSQAKHVLWPIRTAKGNEVTRGWPLAPKVGEKVDHPHHVGLWLNYGEVNDVDFWGNPGSYGKPNPARHGRIEHKRIVEAKGGETGRLSVAADWLMPDGKVVLEEATAFVFSALPDGRMIERTTTLRAKGSVVFKDTKEGMFGLRVARSLEQPAGPTEKGAVVGKDYKPTPSAPFDNTGVTGLYRSSEGKTGDDVWGTRARWMTLAGKASGEDVVIAILDHPKNPGAPTHWHARGYGLFSVNPLGQKDFSSGKQELNFTLEAGQSAVFRYAVAVLSGAFSETRAEELYQGFSKK
jgi:beta-lactamase superfamily II metal-dependent hydrolase